VLSIFYSFDSTYLYQYTFILLYNLVFTSLPVITLGAFDQDVNAHAALAFPQLYVRGIRGLEYTRSKFWLYMLDGLYQSGVVFFIPYFAWQLGLAISWNGKTIDSLSDFGTTVSVAAIFAANTYVGINTNYWTVITWIVVFGSSVVMLLWILVYSFFESNDFNDEVIVLFGELTFWTTVVISVVVALAPRYIVKFITTVYQPLDKHIVREMWVLGDLKDRLGLGHHKKPKASRTYNVEAAPMFRQPHSRSASEVSYRYEPTRTGSPGTSAIARSTQLHTPPSELDDSYAYTRSPPDSGSRSFPASPAYAHTNDDGYDVKDSKHDSYYSMSDIPIPSPLPTPVYRYPSGEFTTTPPSRRTSVKSNATRRHSPPAMPQSPDWLQPPAQSSRQPGVARSGSGRSRNPGAFEMRVRGSDEHHERSASDMSFSTAKDWPGDDDDEGTAHGHQRHTSLSYRHASQPYMQGDDDVPPYQTEDVYRHSRRPSDQSWDGGRAM
jgi:phospholipid-translocating ATPase